MDTWNQGRRSTAATSSQNMSHYLCIAKQHKARKYALVLDAKYKATFVSSPALNILLVQQKGTKQVWNATLLETEKSDMLAGKIIKGQGVGQCLVRMCIIHGLF